MNVRQLAADLQARNAELLTLTAPENLTEEELTRAETLAAECESLQAQIEAAQTAENRLAQVRSAASAVQTFVATPVLPAPHGGGSDSAAAALTTRTEVTIPALAQRVRLRNFTQADPLTGLSPHQQAYQAGMWILATCGGNTGAQRYCREHGIPLVRVNKDGVPLNMGNVTNLAHNEIVNSQGGFAH